VRDALGLQVHLGPLREAAAQPEAILDKIRAVVPDDDVVVVLAVRAAVVDAAARCGGLWAI
jgi:hypothetical protein